MLGVALVAVFAFGVLTAASASAAPVFLLAVWLIDDVEQLTELSMEIDGELELEDNKVPLIGNLGVLCSVLLHGWVGRNSLDYISEELSLGEGFVNKASLVAPGMKCTDRLNCTEPATVWAVNLGWESEVELMEDLGAVFFVDLITSANGTKTVGWEVECNGLSDTCEAAEAVAEIHLNFAILLGTFSRAFTELAGAKLGTCTLGGANTGIVEGTTEFAPDEDDLSASSESLEA